MFECETTQKQKTLQLEDENTFTITAKEKKISCVVENENLFLSWKRRIWLLPSRMQLKNLKLLNTGLLDRPLVFIFIFLAAFWKCMDCDSNISM